MLRHGSYVIASLCLVTHTQICKHLISAAFLDWGALLASSGGLWHHRLHFPLWYPAHRGPGPPPLQVVSASRCRSTGVSKKRHNPFHRANSVSRAMGALEGRPPVSSRGKRAGFPEETCPADPGGEAGQGRLVLASVPSGSCLRVMSSHGFGSALPSSLPSLLRLFSRGFASFLRHFQDHR